MRSRRKKQNRSGKHRPDNGIALDSFSIPPEHAKEVKEAFAAAAAESLAAFPDNLSKVMDLLKQADPIQLVAIFAAYASRGYVGDEGVQQGGIEGILQLHLELLQVLMLSLPPDQWGTGTATPDMVQSLVDTLPLLSRAANFARWSGKADTDDRQAAIIASLQERVRAHTQTVRNWGYFSDVVRISRELYGPMDEQFKAHHGFTCTDAIDVLHTVVLEAERGLNDHWNILRRIAGGKNSRQMLRLYYRLVPALVGTADEAIATMPPGVTSQETLIMIMSHLDLRMDEVMTFSVAQISELSGKTPEIVGRALLALSLSPGSQLGVDAKMLFLNNPIWAAPLVAHGDHFFAPASQIGFSHIHRLVDRLAAEAGVRDRIPDIRSRYLERQLEEQLTIALPGASIAAGKKWEWEGQVFETDIVAVIDRQLVIAEAKSHRITPEALRGAPDRVKRHVQELILEPSIQSERLERIVRLAQEGDERARAVAESLSIPYDLIDRIIRFSVTLDDFSVLSAAEKDFKEVGWVPDDHRLAPTVNIADLACIIDMLDGPLFFLHYMTERIHLQKELDLLGDELDFLGLYLATGFNLGGIPSDVIFTPSGMSAPVDQYYMSRDAGVKLRKPQPNISRFFSDIVRRLSDKRPRGWTTIGLRLLSCADAKEQRRIDTKLDQLRQIVRRTFRDPAHKSTLMVQPPLSRKSMVGFFLFPASQLASERNSMRLIAEQTIGETNAEDFLLFSRNIDGWERAYESVLFIEKRNQH